MARRCCLSIKMPGRGDSFRYGNDICLLDTTNKATTYALSLVFVAVKTNVHYQIVASFVTENETTESIAEALGVVRDWNPG